MTWRGRKPLDAARNAANFFIQRASDHVLALQTALAKNASVGTGKDAANRCARSVVTRQRKSKENKHDLQTWRSLLVTTDWPGRPKGSGKKKKRKRDEQ